MKLPEILDDGSVDQASQLLRDYYLAPSKATGDVRTGARYDDWGGGGDSPETRDSITGDDVIAALFLSIPFPGRAAIGILETHAEKVTQLLRGIPSDVELSDLNGDQFESVLGPDSASWHLWDLLRGKPDRKWGVGPTTASKLMARKRPHLIPIWDSVIKSQTGLNSSLTQWREWHTALTADGGKLASRLNEIQEHAQLSAPISRLRVMDVVLWMNGTDRGRNVPAPVEEDDA
ncbi:DUF6308 family protein [Arthrobacter koreensis]|uniref:DUF6308 family protein n=1 Tax=Arthrobacter koreensis TaxID=199136 RepID=A0ABY6FRE1_9MICC|nr:DUF6308 family protein [Arthrobacter koreensis]UYB35776.1 DUF6308 family protein [Arthrobacter koreensis]